MNLYFGSKPIYARPMKADKEYKNYEIGSDGYQVIFDDFEFWLPKKTFEENYQAISINHYINI